jgi:hypothetical protein
MPGGTTTAGGETATRIGTAAAWGLRLIGWFLVFEFSHITDQRADVCARQFLSESRHPPFAVTHYRDETARVCDIRILLPPLPIGKIGRVVCATERRITSTVTPMTTRTIIPE